MQGLIALTVLLAPVLTLAQARYTPAKTAWGHPDISGDYTNKDEANTPLSPWVTGTAIVQGRYTFVCSVSMNKVGIAAIQV